MGQDRQGESGPLIHNQMAVLTGWITQDGHAQASSSTAETQKPAWLPRVFESDDFHESIFSLGPQELLQANAAPSSAASSGGDMPVEMQVGPGLGGDLAVEAREPPGFGFGDGLPGGGHQRKQVQTEDAARRGRLGNQFEKRASADCLPQMQAEDVDVSTVIMDDRTVFILQATSEMTKWRLRRALPLAEEWCYALRINLEEVNGWAQEQDETGIRVLCFGLRKAIGVSSDAQVRRTLSLLALAVSTCAKDGLPVPYLQGDNEENHFNICASALVERAKSLLKDASLVASSPLSISLSEATFREPQATSHQYTAAPIGAVPPSNGNDATSVGFGRAFGDVNDAPSLGFGPAFGAPGPALTCQGNTLRERLQAAGARTLKDSLSGFPSRPGGFGRPGRLA